MKCKKLASLLIAGLMVFSMAMPAFATMANLGGTTTQTPVTSTTTGGDSDTSNLSRSMQFKGETNVPTISVDMVTEAKIILNPYGLTVQVSGEDKTDPVLTETVYISNQSNCPVDISGTFTPVIPEGSGVKLVATAKAADSGTQAKPADKNVFLAVVMGNVANSDAKIDFGTITGNPTTYRAKMVAATAKANFGTFSAGDKDKSGFYILKAADTATKFGDAADTNTNKTPYTLGTGNETPTYIGMRVFGLCEQWVSSEWKTTDTVSVNMAMTIVPAANGT